MATSNRIAEVAAAVGEPARAAMLAALMDGRALTASELAEVAAITPQTASGHLTRLASVGLIAVEKQGRHRYHRLASPEVARMIESVMQIAGGVTLARPAHRVGPSDAALRQARTCYDHLAGELGVSIADALCSSGAVEIAGDAAAFTESGRARMRALGVLEPDGETRTRRPACRPCLDWSERRPHLAGVLGAAIYTHALDRGWIRRRAGTRALEITPAGKVGFWQAFGVKGTAH
ncbi:ArsR family transcriptional regulator [Cereibacter changlensis]|uniref:ArsR family transcriptional regulator n=1 Tax=Cereibacter changlensis TaxID=402884 RepID=A0A2W7QRJ6_9RHOB|nr:helix-turn-helix domain-containing protein [Cereibacter changlensis]PZX48640.1 ArsR family transcriptional regulator [Cereibacter changlensis]